MSVKLKPLFSPKPPVVTEPLVISEAPDITRDMNFPPEIPCRSLEGVPWLGEPPFEHCKVPNEGLFLTSRIALSHKPSRPNVFFYAHADSINIVIGGEIGSRQRAV